MQQIKATQNKDGTYKVEILDYNFSNEKVTTIIPRAQISITVYNSLDPEGELYTIEVENEKEDTSIKPDFCGAPCGFIRQIIQDQRAQIESLKRKIEALENKDSNKYRCNKCVYQLCCQIDDKYRNNCPYYKRDASDGGYYG